jgi:hypothetical protein
MNTLASTAPWTSPCGKWLARLALVLSVCACGGPPVSSKTEDDARQMIPVPICVKRLPRGSQPGVVVSLTPEEYWSLLLPSYNRNDKTIDPSAPDCSGRLSIKELSPQGTTSLPVDPERTTLAPGADGLKIVWLPSHALAEGRFDGLLALVRQRESCSAWARASSSRASRKTARATEPSAAAAPPPPST